MDKKIIELKQKEKVTTVEVIFQLERMQQNLVKRQNYLKKQIEQESAIMKKNIPDKKIVALQALRKKKRLENQLQQIVSTLSNIEVQKGKLERARVILKSMGPLTKVFKTEHQKHVRDIRLNGDGMTDVIDDILEQQQVAREISNVIADSIGFRVDIDKEDLEHDLENIQQEDLKRKRPIVISKVIESQSGGD